MKGGDLEDRKSFLPKFQPYPLGVGGQQGSPVHHFPGPPLHHPQHHAGSRDTPPPDEAEVDSRAMVLSSPPQPLQAAAAPGADPPRKQKKGAAAAVATGEGAGGDGATIEVVRRPRGRPPGSKNKPKPPVVITREAGDSSNVMRPHILEIPAGHDVVESLSRFSRRRELGLSLLAATGPVSNVTLRQPQFHPVPVVSAGSPAPPPPASTTTVTFHGRFDILSVSATFLPPSFSAASPMLPSTGGAFSISLAGPHGQIVGGCVAGPLVAVGTVTVVAAAFSGPTFHRLPVDDELAVSVSVSPAPPPSGEGSNRAPTSAGSVDLEQAHHHPSHPHQQHLHHHHQQQQQQRQLPQHHHVAGSLAGEHAAAMPMSSSHLLSDVIWAPTARPPHHPSPYQ